MRKLIVFLVFMNLLLLGGGQYLNAGTPKDSHSHHLEKRHRVKFTNQDQGSSIIEDADCDTEEECLGSDDLKGGLSNHLFTTNYSLLDSWYLSFATSQTAANDYNRFKIFLPFCGNSNPFYITQQVLRI
ncbi:MULTISPECIES: hypothetical protein [Flavobacterium]|jgi:hypothetical protein|uniref:hypothetical protein n=1 Tax=Flavobacterium TaxID=237 RepID=UPI0012F957A0|nr:MULTISPECIES: hypothetical protein [Flavobacterium]MDL2142941.1 hypothetical protein [Flavobacterium tructae]URC12638.1 hypothetical protein M4I44_21520 [Flavobacterium sp. B183]